MTCVATMMGPSGEMSRRMPPATISGVLIGSISSRNESNASLAKSARVSRISDVLFQAMSK